MARYEINGGHPLNGTVTISGAKNASRSANLTLRVPSDMLDGVLSGVVEPIGAVLTILVARHVIPALPYLLSFAAGAMLYVVVEELIPEMSQGTHTNVGTIFFAIGFSLMMVLDVALG